MLWGVLIAPTNVLKLYDNAKLIFLNNFDSTPKQKFYVRPTY